MLAYVVTLRQANEVKARWEREHGCVPTISACEPIMLRRRGLKPITVAYRVACSCWGVRA